MRKQHSQTIQRSRIVKFDNKKNAYEFVFNYDPYKNFCNQINTCRQLIEWVTIVNAIYDDKKNPIAQKKQPSTKKISRSHFLTCFHRVVTTGVEQIKEKKQFS